MESTVVPVFLDFAFLGTLKAISTQFSFLLTYLIPILYDPLEILRNFGFMTKGNHF